MIGGNLGGAKYKYMTPNELQCFLSDCVDKGFTFPLNPKWVLCDSGWKALWDKLNNSTHPNVRLSLNAWFPPTSGLVERIEEVHRKYPGGFQGDLSGRMTEAGAMALAELTLERYQRIQRAKLKLWVSMVFIGVWQQCRKRNQACQGETECEMDDNRLSGRTHERRHASFEDPSCVLSLNSQASLHSSECTGSHVNDTGVNASEIKTVNKENEDKLSALTKISRSMIPVSEMGEDDKSFKVIHSVLNSDVNLSEYQKDGLQTIREQFINKSSLLRVKKRAERRHTSFYPSLTSFMLEDVPPYILREYGGAKDDGMSFKAQVKNLINVQRYMKTGTHEGNEHFLPIEWTTMSKESKENLAERLSFSALSCWEYNIIEVAKLCNGSPLLFLGWAILGAPHAQQAMARDLGKLGDPPTSGYNFVTEFRVQMPILCSFLRTVEADYLPNPYHNSTHAADVLQTLNTMLQLGGKYYASSPLDIFSILVAAVIHDVKHPGLNNAFQVNSRSELAIQYNDVSVLENFSITWLFTKLLGSTRDFTVDIFDGLDNEQFGKARRIIIRSVLEVSLMLLSCCSLYPRLPAHLKHYLINLRQT